MRPRERRLRLSLIGFLVATLFCTAAMAWTAAVPANAAQPYTPTSYGLIDCYVNQPPAACVTRDQQPTCAAVEVTCFNQVTSVNGNQKTWWINLDQGSICAGDDRACLLAYQKDSPDTRWIFDHVGASPDVAQNEQVPIKVVAGPTVNNAANAPLNGNNCAKVVNDFSICNIVNLSNAFEFWALGVAIAGIMFSGVLWAVGSHGQNPGQELTGKKGLIVCVVAAFVVGVIPPAITFANHAAVQGGADGGAGVVNAKNP